MSEWRHGINLTKSHLFQSKEEHVLINLYDSYYYVSFESFVKRYTGITVFCIISNPFLMY